MQKITHVAVRRNGRTYSLPAPNRHHDVLWSIPKWDTKEERDIQGFLDDQGNFLTRSEAFVLATQTGQINRRKHEGSYDGTDLYSEDLW